MLPDKPTNRLATIITDPTLKCASIEVDRELPLVMATLRTIEQLL